MAPAEAEKLRGDAASAGSLPYLCWAFNELFNSQPQFMGTKNQTAVNLSLPRCETLIIENKNNEYKSVVESRRGTFCEHKRFHNTFVFECHRLIAL